MAHVGLLHDIELVGRGTRMLGVGTVLLGFAALALAATVYDVGRWLAAW